MFVEYFVSSFRSHEDIQAKRGLLKNTSAASSSKTTLDVQKSVISQSSNLPRKSEQEAEKVKHDDGPKDKDHAKSLAGTKDQPKPTGKLDWSKARSQEQKNTSGAHAKDKTNPQPNQEIKASSSSMNLVDKSSRHFGPQSKTKSIPKPAISEPKVGRYYS